MGRGFEDLTICETIGMQYKEMNVVDNYDPNNDQIKIHWARLVKQPKCVDKIKVYILRKLVIDEDNPADKDHYSFEDQYFYIFSLNLRMA